MHRVGKYDRDRALDALAENDAIELVPVERKQKLATAVAWWRCVRVLRFQRILTAKKALRRSGGPGGSAPWFPSFGGSVDTQYKQGGVRFHPIT